MNQKLILQPVVTMFLLTGIVWAYMYARRLPFILKSGINPQSIATPELLNAAIPANINNSSNNLKNLFELPVIFYALCIVLFVTASVDSTYLYAAWAFVSLRALHSLIHCTINIVNFRFTAYFVSSLVLWFMVGRFALAVL
ncbi:MAG: MAPEG family protein [Moraxellaceae bacterium]|nr:MAPEG family protein [Moraxellaceae bacterium]